VLEAPARATTSSNWSNRHMRLHAAQSAGHDTTALNWTAAQPGGELPEAQRRGARQQRNGSSNTATSPRAGAPVSPLPQRPMTGPAPARQCRERQEYVWNVVWFLNQRIFQNEGSASLVVVTRAKEDIEQLLGELLVGWLSLFGYGRLYPFDSSSVRGVSPCPSRINFILSILLMQGTCHFS
jgi:hypothetical protein